MEKTQEKRIIHKPYWVIPYHTTMVATISQSRRTADSFVFPHHSSLSLFPEKLDRKWQYYPLKKLDKGWYFSLSLSLSLSLTFAMAAK
jgi:hypothetical protein